MLVFSYFCSHIQKLFAFQFFCDSQNCSPFWNLFQNSKYVRDLKIVPNLKFGHKFQKCSCLQKGSEIVHFPICFGISKLFFISKFLPKIQNIFVIFRIVSPFEVLFTNSKKFVLTEEFRNFKCARVCETLFVSLENNSNLRILFGILFK